MFPRLSLAAVAAALVASLALFALPACKKKNKPTEPDRPGAGPAQPNPGFGPPQGQSPDNRDPGAPRSPVFGADLRTATMRKQAEGNVKQILLGLHSYNDANGSLPGGIADKSGKPGLSWRVALLPYVEQLNLYKQFKLDEPWDSAHNKALIPQMPKVFAPPGTQTNGYTFLRGFTGQGTWLPTQSQQGQPGQLLRGARFTDISDGLSNTILVAEAYEPVIWTKPDEVQFTPGMAPRLGGVFASGIVVGMGDGSTKFLPPSVSQKALADAIQINDGHPVDLDQ
jgi:hypothetical protein